MPLNEAEKEALRAAVANDRIAYQGVSWGDRAGRL